MFSEIHKLYGEYSMLRQAPALLENFFSCKIIPIYLVYSLKQCQQQCGIQGKIIGPKRK